MKLTPAEHTGKPVQFSRLRVCVAGAELFELRLSGRGTKIGPLAGARVTITAASPRPGTGLAAIALVGPVGVVAGMRQATAFVVAGNGASYETKLVGLTAVQKAQAEAVRLELLAAQAPAVTPENVTAERPYNYWRSNRAERMAHFRETSAKRAAERAARKPD